MTTPTTRAYVEAFQADHRELRERVESLETALVQGAKQEWTVRAALNANEQLAALRRHLCEHFAHEEAGGYLDEALTHAPRFAHQAEQLLRQHAELRDAMDSILRAAQDGRAPPEAWPLITEKILATLKILRGHEAGENQLVQLAFNVELDAAD